MTVQPSDWAELTSLTADSNQVLSLQGLQYAVNLQSLTLVPGNFADPGHLTDLSPLAGLTNLKSLTLQDCGLNDGVLNNTSNSNPSTALPTLPALQTLDLRYNDINTVSTAVAQLPSLTSLLLYGNPLAGNATQTWYAALSGKLLRVDIAPQDTTSIIAAINPANPTASYTALANAFYNLPLGIYQYLVNTIQYQPYYGAMKGPLAVLETSAGNDWDTDSLLAEVLAQVSQEMQEMDLGSISTSYISGQIEVPMPQAEAYVGASDETAAYDILLNAGLNPIGVTGGDQPDAMQFDHTWLQVQITTAAGTTTLPLDPSWKLCDFQTNTTSLSSGTDLLTTSLVAFDSAAYLSTPQTESAAEFYENQVSAYFASPDNPDLNGLTIADIPYTGPIQPQIFTTTPLPTLPYTVLSQNSASLSSVQTTVDVTLDNGATQLFEEPLNLSDVALSRLTINPNISTINGDATPELLQDGNVIATSSASIANPATTLLTLVVAINSPEPGRSYSKSYPRDANVYLAIGLDANQMSDVMLARDRATVNAQELLEADNQTVNQDAEVGGILNLALKPTLMTAMKVKSPSTALPARSRTTPGWTPAWPPAARQSPARSSIARFRFLTSPRVWGSTYRGDWNALPISSTDGQALNRDLLLGYNISSMEGLVWEELSNYESISTVKDFQLVNQAYPGQNNIETIYSTDDSTSYLETLLHYSSADEARLIGDIQNSLETYPSAYVPIYEVTVGGGTDYRGRYGQR